MQPALLCCLCIVLHDFFNPAPKVQNIWKYTWITVMHTAFICPTCNTHQIPAAVSLTGQRSTTVTFTCASTLTQSPSTAHVWSHIVNSFLFVIQLTNSVSYKRNWSLLKNFWRRTKRSRTTPASDVTLGTVVKIKVWKAYWWHMRIKEDWSLELHQSNIIS